RSSWRVPSIASIRPRASHDQADANRARGRAGPKLWQGLLTLPLRRPKVSNPTPAGDLSTRRRGLETRAEQGARGRTRNRPRPPRARNHLLLQDVDQDDL